MIINSIAYGNGLWVAVGDKGIIMTNSMEYLGQG